MASCSLSHTLLAEVTGVVRWRGNCLEKTVGNGVERLLLSSSTSTVNNRVNHQEDREVWHTNIAALCQTNMQGEYAKSANEKCIKTIAQ